MLGPPSRPRARPRPLPPPYLYFYNPKRGEVPAPNFYRGSWFLRLMPSRQVGSCAQFLRGTAVPAPHGVGSCAQFLQGIGGSCASCLPDRWAPAPNFYEGRRFLRPTASVPALNFYRG